MENQNPSSEPTDLTPPAPTHEAAAPETSGAPETAPEAAPAAPEGSGDPLLSLAIAAKAARLAPADEARATELLKERLSGGRAGINASIEPMVAGLPWVVCVNAVSAVWEQLSAPMRRLVLSGIAKHEVESARRLQLSLARAVFKIDSAAGLKLAAAAAASLKHPETGALGNKHRQFFFNVLIGKGKPWLLQLPLKDLKAAEADALVHGAIECFPICPPFSQLSILRWANEAGRLGKKTSAGDLEIAAKSVARWNAKLQRQLKAEIAEIPPVIAAVLKPEASESKSAGQSKAENAPKQPETAQAETPARENESNEGGEDLEAPEASNASEGGEPSAPEEPAAAPAPEELVIPGRAERLAQKEAARQAKKQGRQQQEQPAKEKERPQRQERERERDRDRDRSAKAPLPFDFKEAMRGFESYVSTLRNELEQTKAQLRHKEEKRPRKERTPEEQSPVEAEALTRHNARLEATIADLQQQLEDLRGHHEAVAESRLLRTDAPLEQGSDEQIRSLLSIQLSEPYETYLAMRKEALDKVFRFDYRDLLGKVFETLMEAGVALHQPKKP